MINNIITLFQHNSGYYDLIAKFFAILTFLVLIMPLQEWAHALTAYVMSDKTEKIDTKGWYNPFNYIDGIGALSFFILGIGWSKSIPIGNLKPKKPKLSLVVVSLAGPVCYFVFAVITGIIYFALTQFCSDMASTVFGDIFLRYAKNLVSLNAMLCALNLFPIPPLDMSKIWFLILPEKAAFFVNRCYPVFMFLLVMSLLFDVLALPVTYVSTRILQAALYVAQLPFLPFI